MVSYWRISTGFCSWQIWHLAVAVARSALVSESPPADPHNTSTSQPHGCSPQPLALCQQEEVGKELGSILWPQSPGVARLLPAGKREFGEISAADVLDNTVKRQRQQGMCLPDENVLPPPPTTGLRGAVPARVCQGSGAPGFIYRTPASSRVYLTLPDWISRHSGQSSGDRGHTHLVSTHTHTKPHIRNTHCPLADQQNSCASFNTQLVCCRASRHSPPRLSNFWPLSAPLKHLLLNLMFTS